MTPKDNAQTGTLVMIPGYGMGVGEEALRLRLLSTWLQLTLENGTRPGAMALYSDGVRLAAASSPVLELLQRLESEGTRLILCKTCIDHFGIADEVRVGIVGGMGDIIVAQTMAAKTITL